MRIPRFFCPELSSLTVSLDAAESHHLARVLRLNPRDRVELFDGRGGLAGARIVTIRKDGVVLAIEEHRRFSPPSRTLVLAVSMAKAHRFDLLVEKCTELGVDHILAVLFERTVKLAKDSSLARYEKIAMSAAKQSGRLFLPRLSGPWPFQKVMEQLREDYPQAVWIYGEPDSAPCPLTGLQKTEKLPAGRDVICLIGPEGGFTDGEKEVLKEAGALPVQINPNVLRIETAAVAFAALFTFLRD